MDIYVVEPGDTVYSIAQKYNVPYDRLAYDNNILPNYNIVNGQIMIIPHSAQKYRVEQGDNLRSIATKYGISVLQLLQNNPFLSDRDYLNIGEELIISYDKRNQQIEVDGFCFSNIKNETLKKVIPFLTYLTIVDYRVNAFGFIETSDNSEKVQLAKTYGVAPIMLVSTFSQQGKGSYGVTNKILNNTEIQDKLIGEILYHLREEGFYGVNFGFSNIIKEDLQNYINLIARTKEIVQTEGYYLFVTMEPNTFGFKANEKNDLPYYSQIGQIADAVVLLSYQWANAYFPSYEQTTIPFLRNYIDYVTTQIPSEKILVGYTRIAYDWEIPYVEGSSLVNTIANSQAVTQASQIGIDVGFDEYYVTPYYYYLNSDGIKHFVWFKDARTLNAIMDFVTSYHLKGISIWNIMDYVPQLWVTINSQYDIKKILNITSDILV